MKNEFPNLRQTTDDELWSRTIEVARKEQKTTLELLHHLHEVERRRLHLERGYASLWEYTQRVLGYSESQTAERISAMRLMFRLEEAREAIESGSLGISQAAMTERHLRAEEKEKKTPVAADQVKSLLAEVQGKSRRETERVLLSHRPRESVSERIRPCTSEESEIRFMASEETRAGIERYWEIKGRGSIGDLFATCLAFYLEANDPAKRAIKPIKKAARGKTSRDIQNPRTFSLVAESESTLSIKSDGSSQARSEAEHPPLKDPKPRGKSSRYIPAEVRREIFERSAGQCEYEDPIHHRRCRSRYRVEFDHVEPYALGGRSGAENIRLLCRAHNAHLADQLFSKDAFEGFFRTGSKNIRAG